MLSAVPEGSDKTLTEINMAPAKVMNELAAYYHVKAQGAVGGKLGSKEFVSSKKAMAAYLKKSDVPAEVVEPTLVYGAGRKDSLTKMGPLLKFCGIFSKKMKPVKVEDAADELVTKMMSHQ